MNRKQRIARLENVIENLASGFLSEPELDELDDDRIRGLATGLHGLMEVWADMSVSEVREGSKTPMRADDNELEITEPTELYKIARRLGVPSKEFAAQLRRQGYKVTRTGTEYGDKGQRRLVVHPK